MRHADRDSRRVGAETGPVCESLEPRIVLSAVENLPTIADLEDASNPVVLWETSLGDVFIELFANDAPNTVRNFLDYVEGGQYSETMFQRLQPGFVLQGGLASYNEQEGLRAVFDEDLGRINSEFGRSNVERTLSMALRGGNVNSATSQFFVNLSDNSGSLDSSRFTVFGRILTDASWNVIKSIEALNTEDLADDPAFQEDVTDKLGRPLFRDAQGEFTLTDTGNPANLQGSFDLSSGGLGATPVLGSYDSADGFQEEDQVEILNAQVVKAQGGEGFYDQFVVLPEGFRSPNSTTRIDLVNPNSVDVDVQMIVRYENLLREEVVASGFVEANETLTITLHDASNSSASLVRANTPYSIEVYTAVPDAVPSLDGLTMSPVAVSLNHFDFGGALGEGFFNASDSDVRGSATTWDFADVPTGDGVSTFITWTSLSDTDGTVTVSFLIDNAPPISVDFDLDAYRRGGVEVHNLKELVDLNLPDGTILGARVESTEPIVAAISTFGGGNASGAMGVPFGGSAQGIIPGLVIPDEGSATVMISNPGGSAAVVSLDAILSDGSVIVRTPSQFVIPAQTQREVDLATVFPTIPADTFFTLRYRSGATPVAGHVNLHLTDSAIGDTIMHAFQTHVSDTIAFADGFLAFGGNGRNTQETISLFNPNDFDIRYQIDFLYGDGTVVTVGQTTLEAGQRSDEISSLITDVANRANQGNTTFSIVVRGFETDGTTRAAIASVANRPDARGLGAFDAEVVGGGPVLLGNFIRLVDLDILE